MVAKAVPELISKRVIDINTVIQKSFGHYHPA